MRGELGAVGVAAHRQGNAPFKAFVDEIGMMRQHDDEGRFGHAVQSMSHVLPPLGRKGFVAAGKAVVYAGNVKGSGILAGPFGQALSPPGRRLYGAVAQNAYRCRFQQGRNGLKAAVILVIAVAVIHAVGKLRRHLPAARRRTAAGGTARR